MGKWFEGDYIPGRTKICDANGKSIAIERNVEKLFYRINNHLDVRDSLTYASFVMPNDINNLKPHFEQFVIFENYLKLIDDIVPTDKGLKIMVKCKDYKKRFKGFSALGVYGPKDNR